MMVVVSGGIWWCPVFCDVLSCFAGAEEIGEVAFLFNPVCSSGLYKSSLFSCEFTFPLSPPRNSRQHATRRQLLNPPEEIESMADSYFQRIYAAEQSIDEVRPNKQKKHQHEHELEHQHERDTRGVASSIQTSHRPCFVLPVVLRDVHGSGHDPWVRAPPAVETSKFES